MRNKLLGQALFDIGSHAAGWTAAILFFFGGGTILFARGTIDNPFLSILAWGQIVVLGAGLVLMAVGHVLRTVADDASPPDLADRVLALEQEVARLGTASKSLAPSDEKQASSTAFKKAPVSPI